MQVTSAVAEAAPGSRLNMLLGDGRKLWANLGSLAVGLVDDDRAVLSSEPFDHNHCGGRSRTGTSSPPGRGT